MYNSNNQFNFNDDFKKCKNTITIKITEEQKKKIRKFAIESKEEKMKEEECQLPHLNVP